MSDKKPTNGELKAIPEVTVEDIASVVAKRKEGKNLTPGDVDIIMRKTAQDMRAYANAKQKGGDNASPIEHVANVIGVDQSALSSYFFTSYGVFQKDLKNKTNPYIAFSVALIHALNLGYFVGTLDRKEEYGTEDTTDEANW